MDKHDINELDITKLKDFDFLFKNKKIDNILMEHVVEHLEYDSIHQFSIYVKKYLKRVELLE
jgi:predicted SAM-dependent methyltransferase